MLTLYVDGVADTNVTINVNDTFTAIKASTAPLVIGGDYNNGVTTTY